MLNNASYILFYHRITPENLKIFQWQLQFLKERKNISTIYEMENLTPNSVIITFDDGFFDNFVYAYPLLKKYNIPAAIFLSTAYIRETGVRKTLQDYWDNNVSFNELQQVKPYDFGKIRNNEEFLTWREISVMHKSGLINFESHGHEHLRHNIEREKKVSHFKGVRYYEKENRYESLKEREERLMVQFLKPKELIKYYLNYTSEHFCWQWGEYDDFALNLGKSLGFKYFYTTEKGTINDNFYKINRISASFKKSTFFKRNLIFSSKMLSKKYLKIF